MCRLTKAIIFSAILAGLFPCLQDGPEAFELFPRPEQQYTVQRGDNLYGIAGLYYTNPGLWPYLWNQNPAVRIDPQEESPEATELEPGTKMNLYHTLFPTTVMNQNYKPPTGLPLETQFLTENTVFKGIPYDKKYFKYKLSRRPTRLWGYIVGSPDTGRQHYLERDLVFVRFRPSKKQAILVGDRFGVYRERGPLHHPENPDRSVGYMAELVGEVEITNTSHELHTAIVLDSYVELKRGDRICLFTPRAREIVPSKTHRLLVGTILNSASRTAFYNDTHNLENDIVFINRGECDGVKEGTLLNIYRTNDSIHDPFFFRQIPVPDKYIGEGMVLKVFDRNSTVIITRSREEVVPGDIIKTVSD